MASCKAGSICQPCKARRSGVVTTYQASEDQRLVCLIAPDGTHVAVCRACDASVNPPTWLDAQPRRKDGKPAGRLHLAKQTGA